MKNSLSILAVVFALVFVAIAVSVGIVLNLSGPANQPIGVFLVYEVDSGGNPHPIRMDNVIAAVDHRVNPGWTRRARVQRRGNDRIEIGVYGNDPKTVERIERLLETAGTLEFRILANRHDHPDLLERAESEGETERFENAVDGQLPAWWVPVASGSEGVIQYPEILRRTREVDGREQLAVLVVGDDFNVTGDYLVRITAEGDQRGMPCLGFTFNQLGGRLFSGLTGSNLPDPVQGHTRKLGIILNGQLVSAPSIQSTISDRGEITGNFTRDEVQDLVEVFNAGALPGALRQVERRAVMDGK